MKEFLSQPDEFSPYWRFRCILRPESIPRFIWELLVAINLLFLAFLTPYLESFESTNTNLYKIEEFLSVSVFSIDILLNLNTGYYEKGDVIIDRLKIIKNYCQFWFWFDSTTTIPYSLLIPDTVKQKYSILIALLKMIKLLRLVRLQMVLYRIEDQIFNEKFIYLMMIFKLLLYLFIIGHFFACLMFSVSNSQLQPDSFISAILNKSGNADLEVSEIYVSSLYWAFTTMASVGYGDISPQNTNERLTGVFIMFCSSITFGIIIGNIGNIMEKYTMKETVRREILVNFNHFMKFHNLKKDLRTKVRMYVDYAFHYEKYSEEVLNSIISTLSQPLQEEILLKTNGNILKTCKTFTIFPSSMITKFAKLLFVKVFLPLDNIIRETQTPQGMFFIVKGKVEVVDFSTSKRIIELGRRDTFGEIGLFTKQPCVSSIYSRDYCETLFLALVDFEEYLKVFPSIGEKLEEIRKSCCDGNYSALLISCYSCLQIGHIAKNCQAIVSDEMIKSNWIQRNRLSKNVNPCDRKYKVFQRKVKKVERYDYSAKNVLGRKRKIKEQFYNGALAKNLKRYFQNNIKNGDYLMYTEESCVDTYSVACNGKMYKKILTSSDEFSDCEDRTPSFRSMKFNFPK
jgi:hypothetical protein